MIPSTNILIVYNTSMHPQILTVSDHIFLVKKPP